MITYCKNGHKLLEYITYCREHFVINYGREPGTLDAERSSPCGDFHHCDSLDKFGHICGGILELNNPTPVNDCGVVEWTCRACGVIKTNRLNISDDAWI